VDGGVEDSVRAGEAAIHAGGIEGQDSLPRGAEGDEPAIAAMGQKFSDDIPGGLFKTLTCVANAGGDVSGGGEADEDLAGTGGGDGAGGVVRIGARADDRRIPYPARTLGRDAAGRGAGGEVARGIARDSADGAVAVGIRTGVRGTGGAAGEFEMQRVQPSLSGKVFRRHDLNVLGGQKLQRALSCQQHRAGGFHDGAGGEDGVARTANARERAGRMVEAGHDGGVHLQPRIRGEDRATGGVEERVVLQRHHGGGDGIERRTAFGEDFPARFERGAQGGVVGIGGGLVQRGGRNGAGAAMDGDGGLVQAHGSVEPVRMVTSSGGYRGSFPVSSSTARVRM